MPVARRRVLIPLTVAAVALAALSSTWLVGQWTRAKALRELSYSSGHVLSLVTETLRGELAKHQSTPVLLAHNPWVTRVVTGSASPSEVQTANVELERLADVTKASDLYLMSTSGLTVAASNWRQPRSFIGENFSYRPYFKEAMKGRLGRYFALGTTSGERGYYFAHPIFDGRQVVGATVVKLTVGALEAAWRAVDHTILVVDDDGVIFLSSEPGWVLKTIRSLDAAAEQRLAEQRRYGAARLEPLNIEETASLEGQKLIRLAPPRVAASRAGGDIGRTPAAAGYLMQSRTMDDAGWTIHILSRTAGIEKEAAIAMALTVATLAALGLAATVVFQRRRRTQERLALQASVNAELERRVAARTDELTSINMQLEQEIGERTRTEAELRQTQAGLIQASKLAALGQMSAGLSHELNQPLAAIRSYAENARALLDRDRADTARSNLTAIDQLTQRMARIIRHLRTFAREEPIAIRPTSVRRAIDETLGLLQRRISDVDARIDVAMSVGEPMVLAGDVRLQQVLVNLVGNALDAVKGRPVRDIRIAVTPAPGGITLSVEDTGPGIAAENIANVFDPFFTTKAVGDGLGLGLSITYGLIKQFGGSIEADNCPGGGARFLVTLRSAQMPLESAA